MTPNRFQNKYRIQSARASWHDYNGGSYFVTICTAGRKHYFGEIVSGNEEPQMILSEIGQCVVDNLQNVTHHYAYAEIPLFVVMPNHVHVIVVIDNQDDCGDAICGDAICRDAICRDAINRVSTTTTTTTTTASTKNGGITGNNNPMLLKCLGTVIRGMKARVTHFAHQNKIEFAWQTRFHDHIIRDQNEMNRIANYIENNVAQWNSDCFMKTDLH